jgi:hypothetical protein
MHSPYRTRNTARHGMHCDHEWINHIEKLAVSTDVHVVDHTIGTGAGEDAVFQERGSVDSRQRRRGGSLDRFRFKRSENNNRNKRHTCQSLRERQRKKDRLTARPPNDFQELGHFRSIVVVTGSKVSMFVADPDLGRSKIVAT